MKFQLPNLLKIVLLLLVIFVAKPVFAQTPHRWSIFHKRINPTPTPVPSTANLINSFVTYYGWADNTPSGTDIAFPGTVHMAAGGTGTYSDPVTMASDPKVWPTGTKMYVPYIKKYVVMEDICGGCTNNPATGQYHIDIWMNSDSRNTAQLLACENAWTRTLTQVEINPPSNRLVSTTPLFDPSTGICLSSI